MSAKLNAPDWTEARRKLDAFLVDNDELESLNARLSQFNTFRVLRIERAEIRHSNVLAWLLNPSESHGLGSHFLRRFLSTLLLENEIVNIDLTPARIELMTFDEVEVRREWRNIDVLAFSDSNRWCLLIENKVRGHEGKDQLKKYQRAIAEEFPGFEILPVLLSLEGDEPSESGNEAGFIPLAYGRILELAERIVTQHSSRITPEVRHFIEDYLSTLRRLTMQDQGIVDLCKTIYRRHREAIDLIVQYGSSSQVLDACQEKLPALTDPEFVHRKANSIWFVPTEMARLQPTVELTGWSFLPRSVPVVCWFWFSKRKGKLVIIMEVGPMKNAEQRRALMLAIRDAGFSFLDKALLPDAKFTRILRESKTLRQADDSTVDDDPEQVQRLAESLWNRFWAEGKRIVGVLKAFNWNEHGAPATPRQ